MDAVIQYFIERWPILTIGVVVVVGIVWIAVRITKRTVKSDYLEEKFENMPCEGHTAKINDQKNLIERLDERTERFEARMDKIETRMEQMEKTLLSVNSNILAIQTFLQTKYKNAAPIFSQKYSPRRLNPKGLEVFNQFGGKEFLDANESMLIARMERKKPKTALDVEQDALDVLYETLDDDIYNEIKLKVYNSKNIMVMIDGKEEEYSITMGDICFIFSLDLRDRYLKQHPEVPQGAE